MATVLQQYPSILEEQNDDVVKKEEDDDDDDDDDGYNFSVDDGYDHHRDHSQNLSRLSIPRSTTGNRNNHHCEELDYEEEGNYINGGNLRCASAMGLFLSRLSIESSDIGIEADEEVSDDDDDDEKEGKEGELVLELSVSDSDKELLALSGGCYSLLATPPPQRTTSVEDYYYYASENDVDRKGVVLKQKRVRQIRRRRSITRERWLGRYWEKDTVYNNSRSTTSSHVGKNGVNNNDSEYGENLMMQQMCGFDKITSNNNNNNYYYYSSGSGGGESEGGSGSGGGGLMVIAKPKGGKRALCMDLEEVKACRDLGFELEHQQMMLEMPPPLPPTPHISISACPSPTTHIDTSSPDCSSPIASWHISSPGDDPRDVKARLKVWAQAVALASTSWQTS